MSRKYRFGAAHLAHFVTFTVIDWIDFFTRDEFRRVLIDSIRYCQQHKGLQVYGYCIMPSHVHLIVRSQKRELWETIRDLKRHTSTTFKRMLQDESNTFESRSRWLLWFMRHAGAYNPHNNDFQFWVQDSHPIELWSDEVFYQKLDYIHLNPVAAGFVEQPEHWIYSSARDFAGRKGLIELDVL